MLLTGGVAGGPGVFDAHGPRQRHHLPLRGLREPRGGGALGAPLHPGPALRHEPRAKWAYSTGAFAADRSQHRSRGARDVGRPNGPRHRARVRAEGRLGRLLSSPPPRRRPGALAHRARQPGARPPEPACPGAGQDGVVYAVDADTGALVWQTPAGPGLPGCGGGGFTAFGLPRNRLLLGTRNSTGGNSFLALDPATGVPVGAPYTGAEGGGLGPVSAGASVDYATSRVYFASRAAGAAPHTVWCLEVTAGGSSMAGPAPSRATDGSP